MNRKKKTEGNPKPPAVRIGVGIEPLISLHSFAAVKNLPKHSQTRIATELERNNIDPKKPNTYNDWEQIINNLN